MDLLDTITIHQYHNERIKQFGAANPKSLGWKTTEGQLARFEILSGIGNLNNTSVMDVGCGHGDLRGYLAEKFTGIRYLGIDQVEAFLDVAIEKYGALTDTSFFHGDFSNADLPVTDYILACGALSYRNSDADFALKTITKLFNSCRLGFGFNMLSAIDNPLGILIAFDPDIILSHCNSLTSKVVFKEGYYEHDFTVMLYKDVD